ncbi:hypothetical protein L218DRAFT_619430 [Marasmius fiardii PR-910]|nr:hypothetical protein L218DRAFT_619430 [Marasmius fiardii PR-910]
MTKIATFRARMPTYWGSGVMIVEAVLKALHINGLFARVPMLVPQYLVHPRQMLDQFLVKHKIRVFFSPTSRTLTNAAFHLRRESAEFRHFMDLDCARLRLADSSSNVKALFNVPGGFVYKRDDNVET